MDRPAGTCDFDAVGDDLVRVPLTDDALAEAVCQIQHDFYFIAHHATDRDAGPVANYSRHHGLADEGQQGAFRPAVRAGRFLLLKGGQGIQRRRFLVTDEMGITAWRLEGMDGEPRPPSLACSSRISATSLARPAVAIATRRSAYRLRQVGRDAASATVSIPTARSRAFICNSSSIASRRRKASRGRAALRAGAPRRGRRRYQAG